MGHKGLHSVMKNLVLTSAVTLFVLFSFVTMSFANGVLLDGKGPIILGRGGTNIAHRDNGMSILDNPAALASLKGKRIDASVDTLILPMNYRDTLDDQRAEDEYFLLPTLAYTQSKEESGLGMGIGVYNPAGFSAEYRLNNLFYGNQKYFSNASLTKILVGAGWKVNERLSIGAGIGPTYGITELELPYTFQTGPLSALPPTFIPLRALINLEADDWGFGWNLGAQWEISSSTTLGFTFIAQDKLKMQGDVDVDISGGPFFDPNVNPDPTAHYKVNFDFKWPQILGVGVKHKIESGPVFSLDVLLIDWSSAFDALNLKLSEGDNLGFNFLTGGSSTTDSFPMHWNDSYSFRLGFEHSLNEKDMLRFGYIYNTNPVPAATLTPLIPGILQNEATLGFSRNWEDWTFGVSYMYAFQSKRTVTNSDILGGDFDQSTVQVSAHFLSLGFQYKF